MLPERADSTAKWRRCRTADLHRDRTGARAPTRPPRRRRPAAASWSSAPTAASAAATRCSSAAASSSRSAITRAREPPSRSGATCSTPTAASRATRCAGAKVARVVSRRRRRDRDRRRRALPDPPAAARARRSTRSGTRSRSSSPTATASPRSPTCSFRPTRPRSASSATSTTPSSRRRHQPPAHDPLDRQQRRGAPAVRRRGRALSRAARGPQPDLLRLQQPLESVRAARTTTWTSTAFLTARCSCRTGASTRTTLILASHTEHKLAQIQTLLDYYPALQVRAHRRQRPARSGDLPARHPGASRPHPGGVHPRRHARPPRPRRRQILEESNAAGVEMFYVSDSPRR